MKQLFTFLAVLLAISVLGQGTIILGTDTTFNGTFEHPTPYGTHYNNLRIQYLVRSGELSGLGLAAGEITAIAFNVHAPNNCSPMPDFTIRIKQTAINELSDVLDNEGFTTVFFSPSYLPLQGWNSHPFVSPFAWDGQSSLLVDVCFALIQGSYTQNASVYYSTTPGFNSAVYFRSTSIVACGTSQPGLVSPKRANMMITGILASCLPPLNLTTDDITSGSVTLGWTAQGTAGTWDLIYGYSGFDPNVEGTLIQGIGTDYHTISGLEQNTDYDFYARSVCSPEDISAWSLPVSVTTLCQSASLPFSEYFQSPITPACWYQTFDGTITSERWTVNNSSFAGGEPWEMRGRWIHGIGVSRLVTAPLDLSGLSQATLYFKHFFDDWSEGCTMKIQSSADGINWVDEDFSFQSGYGNIGPETISLEISTLSPNTLIAWVMDGDHFGIDFWYIDDVMITGISNLLPGDANCDETVNLLDLIAISNEIMNISPQPFCFQNADINGDGIINLIDLIGTVNIILSK